MAKVVIVGGYGQVGSEAARALASVLPGQVVIAGRDLGKAKAYAKQIGQGVEGIRLDVTDPAWEMPETALVLMCTEARDTELARRCLAKGTHYVDVTADADRLAALERLDPVARQGHATGALSVGLAPGVTNLLAAHVVRGLSVPPERVDVLVVLGLGDAHGPAAIEWTLDALGADDAFRARTRFLLPGRARPVHAFSFAFPEDRTLPATLGVARADSWLAFEPAAATLAAALAVRLGAGRVLRRGAPRRMAVRALTRAALGPDTCAAAARAGKRQAALTGRREATLTGLVAATVTRRLLEGSPTAGVFHVEQLFDPVDVLGRLADADPSVQLMLPSS